MDAKHSRVKVDDAFCARVHELWQKGLTPKAIAYAVGANATSVYRAMRKIYKSGRPPQRSVDVPRPPKVSSDIEGAHRIVKAKCQRCPECGGMVLMPCYLCYVRGIKNKESEK